MAEISRYTQPIQNTLEQYVPIPFQEMLQAGQMIQQRGDLQEQQNMQVDTGLASTEALAPAYKQFVNKYVQDYRSQASNLLDKYKGNTSNPDFIRESKRLNMTFAADPRLQTIKQGNEVLKTQQKLAQELSAKGVKYIDPNRSFTGVDQQGNLVAPSGSLRGTNFDEDITKSFLQIRDNMIDNGRGWKTNKPNIDQLAKNYIANIETNPLTRDAIDYYQQQGLSPQQARQATAGLIRQAYTDNLRTDRDYAYDNLQLSKAQLALSQRRQAMDEYEFKAKFNAKKNQGLGLVPEQSNINPEDLNKSLINDVDGVLKNLNNAGGLSREKFVVSDTPENRKKYAGKFTQQVSTTGGSGMGYAGGQDIRELVVSGSHNKDHIEVLKAARDQLGSLAKSNTSKSGYMSDKTVLERYKQFLKNDNAAYTFWNTQSGDVLKQLDNIYVGSAGEKLGNAVIVRDGKMTRVANDKVKISDYDGFSFSGISAAPTKDTPNGAIKVTAVGKKGTADEGKIVQFLKPLDAQTASYFPISNKGYRALTSGKSNDVIAKDQSLYISDGQGGVLVPQKTPNGGINLFYINPNTGERLNREPLPFQEYINEEHNNFNQYINQFSNKG